MRYACLIYFDPQKVFGQSAEAEAVLGASGPYNNELKASGHLVMDHVLQLPDQAMTLQVRDGKMSTLVDSSMERSRPMTGARNEVPARIA